MKKRWVFIANSLFRLLIVRISLQEFIELGIMKCGRCTVLSARFESDIILLRHTLYFFRMC
jgi:hypothetical protein